MEMICNADFKDTYYIGQTQSVACYKINMFFPPAYSTEKGEHGYFHFCFASHMRHIQIIGHPLNFIIYITFN